MSNPTLDLSKAVYYDITAYRDTKVNETLIPVTVLTNPITGKKEYYPVDLTTYSGATLQVRQTKQSEYILLEASTNNGMITLTPDKIILEIPATAMRFNAGVYYYDFKLKGYLEENTRVLFFGIFKLERNITD